VALLEHDYAARRDNLDFLLNPHVESNRKSESEEEIFMDSDNIDPGPTVDVSCSDGIVHNLECQVKELQDKLEALQVENQNLKKTNLEQEQQQKSAKNPEEDLISNFFSPDELDFLKRKTMRGKTWTSSTIKKALQLRFSCGRTGYENLLSLGYPLPAIRTLQKRTENIMFDSGILYEVLEAMSFKIKAMNPQEKLCCLTMDEMSVKSSLDYDVKSDSFIGDVTLPHHEGIAKKALVYQLGGVSTR
jgi:hypothetical protein